MRTCTVRGIAAAAAAVVVLGAGASHVRAETLGVGKSALLAKVYRVFGDDVPADDGAKATRRTPRRRARRNATKRPRVERHATPSPNEAEPHTGVLELIQANNA